MKEIKIVVGANFGDEGKGLMTDYFCAQFPKSNPVLNVRFNGGAQAGHTVVSLDKGVLRREHVFSHFGAGSFHSNVATYLGPEFIVNPILFRREYEKLARIGIYPMVYVHPRCLITMPQDMMINQFMETRRGSNRHGSCGVGIYETLLREKEGAFPMPASVGKISGPTLPSCQVDIGYYDHERIEKTFGLGLDGKEKDLLSNQNIRAHFNQDLRFFIDHVTTADSKIYKSFDYIVFEGGQGLMLDQNNVDYFPHLTPSNTGVQNVADIFASGRINAEEVESIEVCYVTRTYLTRHGAGRLDNECQKEVLGVKPDLTNIHNKWQGSLRYAPLDFKELKTRIQKDSKHILKECPHAEISIAVTHMDELKLPKEDAISSGIGYFSFGPTRLDVVNAKGLHEYE